MQDHRHPRDTILATMDRIYRYRMTTTSGGNVSVRGEDGDIWITPARVDKGNLRREDIIRCRPDGTHEGPHPPSSEFPFHRAIYAERDDVAAVVHAHPPSLVAFSICGQLPDTRLFHQAHSVCGKLGFAPYACPGTKALGDSIAATFAKGADSVVMENHGVVVGGCNLDEAFSRFEALEFAAKIHSLAMPLGEVQSLSDAELRQAANRRVDFETFRPESASNVERELRRQLMRFLRRGCEGRLLISTEGSFSARVDANAFVITPTRKDRERLGIEDFVLVDGDRREWGKRASRAAWAHRAIYRRHPEVGAIVLAHPPHATALSVTRSAMDVRTIPESYVFLRDVGRVPYGVCYAADDSIADHVCIEQPATLLQNDGALVVGRNVLDAFDRLEVLEATAAAILQARSIGPVRSMGDEVIAELREVFGTV